ncbi:hypothetical protein IQ238_17935 [Pleurocapsales cyanobacterium LEGE 06147]|nr:hypothetical protein [Pleurocapsales cyanobacterium LEGE 06147]
MKRMAIVIRDDGYDRLYTPLTFAYVAAKAVKIDRQHAAEEDWFKDRLRRDGDPLAIHDFIKLVKRTGNVQFYGCQLAAATFDVTESQLIPEADGIVDSLWFLEEKAIKADRCQYF